MYQAYITTLKSGNFDKGRNTLLCKYLSLKQFFISYLLSYVFELENILNIIQFCVIKLFQGKKFISAIFSL